MNSPRKTHRRDFLRGKAAADELTSLVERRFPGAPSATSSSGTSTAAASTYLLQFGRRAMACQFEVSVNAGQYDHAQEALLDALDLIEDLEGQLTVYRESSEIMHINRQAAELPVAVEPRLFALLEQAVALHEATEGAFDITAGPLTKVWGFYRRQGCVPEPAALAEALQRVGSDQLELDATARTIRFRQPGVELNLGSIGKGYALDRAAELLRGRGIEDFLWHGGNSSVLAAGSHAARSPNAPGWTVGVIDPLRPTQRLAEVRLHNRALATSGSSVQFFRHEGRRYGHVIDPRSGQPASGVLSATAIAPTAAEADALSTAFYIMGVDATRDFCARRPEVAAILVIQRSEGGPTELISTGLPEDALRLFDRVRGYS